MQRIYCDGCWRAGIKATGKPRLNDLTDRKNDIFRVSVDDGALRMDLCPERCAPIYFDFKVELARLTDETRARTVKAREEFMQRFWGALEDGNQEGPADAAKPAEQRLRERAVQGSPEGQAQD